jgi:hypothetical protein
MLLDERLKAFPIGDFMPIPLLEARDGLIVSGFFLPLELQV